MSGRALTTAQKQSATQASPLAGRVLQRQCACGNHATGGECEECKKKTVTLQRASSPGPAVGRVGAIPPIVGDVVGSAGQPLRADTRERMEQHFEHDFSGVRVHSNRQARLSAEAVQARAYTVGQHIVFGEGLTDPTDMRLLSHELAHVVQQSRGGGAPGIDADPALEADADRAASDVLHERPARVSAASAVGIAREEKPAGEIYYEVNFPEGKKRLTAAEFEAQKRQALSRMRVDLKLVSDLAEVGRQSQVDMLKEYQGGVESLGDVVRKPKALIGIAADIWGNTTPPYIGMWSHPKNAAASGIAAADRGDLREAARLLGLANTQYRDAMHEWNAYREKTIGGAESLKSDLELVRDVSFGIALAAGAVVAAPVVAGVVGVGGVAGTALTAGGTALVVGAGGAALGGGSAAAASYAVEGKVDWKETKKQAARFGKQGAVTGLTAGLGTAVGAAGKATELAQPIVQQTVRRCLTEAGINVAGEITAEALDQVVPTETPEQKAESESKAVIPAKARTALIGCVGGALGVPTSKLRSGTAKAADVGVGAGVAFVDAKLQGQTNKEAALAAAQSAGTSHLVGMGKKGSDAAKARKEAAKAPTPAVIDEHAAPTPTEIEKQVTPAAKPTEAPHDKAPAKPPQKGEGDDGRRRADQPDPQGPATSVKKEESKATKRTVNDHEVVVTDAGIGVCSPPPCPVIHVEYKKELDAHPELKEAYEKLQAARKKDPEGAAALADALIRELEQLRTTTDRPIDPRSLENEYAREMKEYPGYKQRLDEIQGMAASQSNTAARRMAELQRDLQRLRELSAHIGTAAELELDGHTFEFDASERRKQNIRSGKTEFHLEHPIAFDIDEPLPVGGADSRSEGLKRALDPHNRQLLDPRTNRQTKHLREEDTKVTSEPKGTSIVDNPESVFTHRFDEVHEMKQIFGEAVAKIKNPESMPPTALKNQINENIRDIIQNGRTSAGKAVRDALKSQGFEYVEGRGLVAVKREGATNP
jgi:hypothetical protein